MFDWEFFMQWMSVMWKTQFPIVAATSFGGYLWYLASGTECIIDFFWIFNHWVVGSSFMYNAWKVAGGNLHWSDMVSYGLLSLWFLRLGGFLLFTRVLKGHDDKRYALLRRKFGNSDLKMKAYFLFNYEWQASFLILTGSTLYFVFSGDTYSEREFGPRDWLTFGFGTLLSIKGLVMQLMADNQLEEWKAGFAAGKKNDQQDEFKGTPSKEEFEQREMRKKFHRNLIDGLWKYTRHPNLFHEIEFWLGLAIVGLHGCYQPNRL